MSNAEKTRKRNWSTFMIRGVKAQITALFKREDINTAEEEY